MPTVSVIIPCYNIAELVTDAINSVLAQTYKDYEIVVVDDGSSDNIDEVIESYDAPIKLIKQTNAGPSAARNNGMRNATGDYLAFLDADDIWLPSKLDQQVKLLDADSSVGLTFCDGFRWIPPSKPQQGSLLSELYVHPPERPKLDLLFKIHMIPTSSILFRSNLLKNSGYINEELRGGEDYEFFLRLAARGMVVYIDTPLMAYRVHPGSTSSVVTRKNVRERIYRKLKARHIALVSIPRLRDYLDIRFFAVMPPFIRYLMLLWWRLRYGGSKKYLWRSLIKYGKKLLLGKDS